MSPATTPPRTPTKAMQEGEMIARIWRGWTKAADGSAYVEYVRATGLAGYRSTPGNRGAYVLLRTEGDRCEIVTLSLWESHHAIRRFAGDDIDAAVFYPEDDRWLIERETRVKHYEVAGGEA